MEENNKRLTPLSDFLISKLDLNIEKNLDKMVSVDPVVSEVATWYEKLRNAMDYREEDVILRAAIERILKRRLILGGNGESVAEPLVRELVWARYFPDDSVPEALVEKVSRCIDLFLKLELEVIKKHKPNRATLSMWIMQLLSSEIEYILNPNRDRDLISNFIFQILKHRVQILDDSEENKDAQVFIAVRKTFNKEDQPLLRYNLFIQLFDHLSEKNLEGTAQDFIKGIKKIESELNYPIKDRIYTFVKKQVIPFFIFEDVLKKHQGKSRTLVEDEEKFKLAVLNSCTNRYENIKAKVGTAIIRGIIFIFVTKALFAFLIEGTFENLIFGKVYWNSIILNTLFPPMLMVVVGLGIKTPGKENSLKIFEAVKQVLYKDPKTFGPKYSVKLKGKKSDPILHLIFILLWFLALTLSFGSVVYLLNLFRFNPISQGVFIFFLAIVSFISYRINQTAHMYTLEGDKQSIKAVLFDFFFMPFVRVGRNLTENISKLNIVLMIFDLFIETPFKTIFAFFEQWFSYLRTQREKLG